MFRAGASPCMRGSVYKTDRFCAGVSSPMADLMFQTDTTYLIGSLLESKQGYRLTKRAGVSVLRCQKLIHGLTKRPGASALNIQYLAPRLTKQVLAPVRYR